VRAPDLRQWKRNGQKIAMLTAYDALLARLLERAGADILLVGDSLGMVMLGYETTIPVTVDDVVHHTRAVSRAVRRPLVVADLPFLSYHESVAQAVRNAGRLLQEGGAAAVKVEGGRPILDVVRRLVEIGVPVMGHLGLTPQAFHSLGGFRRQAREAKDADALLEEARELEAAGAFALVVEAVPEEVGARAAAELAIPVIGIGAGPSCDGQVLVTHDMLGLNEAAPAFVQRYARLGEAAITAAAAYVDDVRAGRFGRPEPEQ